MIFFIFVNTNNENVSNAKLLFDIRLYLNCNQLSLIAHKLIPKPIIVVIVDIAIQAQICAHIHRYLCDCVYVNV